MIISTDAITCLLIDKTIDDKTIFKLAKLQNIEISDSLRKNLTNFFSNKHVQSRTTLKGVKAFLKDLVPIDSLHKDIDQLDFHSQTIISNLRDSLIYLESGYVQFFEVAKLNDSFVCSEIRGLFRTLFNLAAQKDDEIPTKDIMRLLLKEDLMSKLDLENDIYFDLSEGGVVHKKFSLNLLLYLCACLDVNNGRNDHSTFQLIFERLLSDIDKLKAPFYYYVELIKAISLRHGVALSKEKLCEILNIEPKSFSRYMNGARKVHIKHIGSIMDNGDFLYFCVLFWVNLLVKFCKTDQIRLMLVESLNRYPLYYDIALLNFHKFKTNELTTTQSEI